MAGSIPKVLVLGHSFIKRLKNDLDKNFDRRASRTFGLVGTAEVHLPETGGRTVGELKSYDLHVVCLRAVVSYFLCCTQKRDVCVTPSLIVFQRPAGFPRSWEHALIG